MSRLDKLIKKLCPNGVEYKTLGELGDFYGGLTGKTKADFTNGNAKFISYKNVYSNPAIDTNTEDRVVIREGEQQRTLEYGDIIFTGSSENPWECGISSVLTESVNENLYLNSFCFIFRLNDKSILDPNFSKHLFRSSSLREQIGKTANGVTRYNVSKKLMGKVKIPIPPLEIQEEIVKILDKFTDYVTELQVELQAELQARKQQYEYYSSKLLSEADSEWIAMSELASFVYGYTDSAKDIGDARFIRITDIDDQGCLKSENPKYITLNDEARKSLLSHGDLVMARTGATYGKTLYFEDGMPSVYASFLIKIQVNNRMLDSRYYWHFTKTSLYWDQANKLVTNGGQQQFNTPAIKKVKVPVPSLEEQHRIVRTLDRFDKLCNDISIGLPAEIEARQKQYEYYRDKLLTFKELEVQP